jgi:hypothetical protein
MLGNELLLDASTYRSNFQMRTSHQTHADLVERQNNSRCQALLYRNHDEVLRADWRRWEPEVTRLTSPKVGLHVLYFEDGSESRLCRMNYKPHSPVAAPLMMSLSTTAQNFVSCLPSWMLVDRTAITLSAEYSALPTMMI